MTAEAYPLSWPHGWPRFERWKRKRAIERHGGGQILERAFTGFTALSGPDTRDPFAILGLRPGASREDVQAKFRTLAKDRHPDAGGSDEEFQALQRARDEALRRAAA